MGFRVRQGIYCINTSQNDIHLEMYDQKLSRRLSTTNSALATSRVFILRVTLRTTTKIDLETLVFSSLNDLTRPGAREEFIIRPVTFGVNTQKFLELTLKTSRQRKPNPQSILSFLGT